MARRWGSYDLRDTRATLENDVPAWEYGLDNLWDDIDLMNQVHEEQVRELFSLFVNRSNERFATGGVDVVEGEFIPVAEDGIVDAQKTGVTGYNMGFPLNDFMYMAQWTERYLKRATVGQIREKVVAMQNGDIRRIRRDMLYALHHGQNYDFTDHLVDRVVLPVKALFNADGAPIARDEFGGTFDPATHTHYLGYASGSVVAADIQKGVDTVSEHVSGSSAEVTIVVNKAQIPLITGMTANFDALQPPLINPGPGSTADQIVGDPRTNPYVQNNRQLGVWDGYVWVWVKPWALPGYIYFILTGGDNDGKVLRMREDDLASYRGLRMVASNGYPLGFSGWSREFGFGVQNRAGAALLYTAGTTYVEPTLSL